MSGVFYYTGYSNKLAEFYELDGEVPVYDSQHYLLGKVHYYLAYPAEVERIRQADHMRALCDHSFQQLFEAVGLASGRS